MRTADKPAESKVRETLILSGQKLTYDSVAVVANALIFDVSEFGRRTADCRSRIEYRGTRRAQIDRSKIKKVARLAARSGAEQNLRRLSTADPMVGAPRLRGQVPSVRPPALLEKPQFFQGTGDRAGTDAGSPAA